MPRRNIAGIIYNDMPLDMIKGFYFITDPGLTKKGIVSDVRAAISAGVDVVQYRNKEAADEESLSQALELREICRNVLFLINDRVDIALASGADGVHLGKNDISCREARSILGKDKIIGMTAHSLDEAIEAEEKGANYLGVGPVFGTNTKKDAGPPCGAGLIEQVKETCKVPVVGIGGIDLDNAEEVIKAGADAVCAISAVVSRDNVEKEIKKFQKLFRNVKKV